jgi:hypothetical protein
MSEPARFSGMARCPIRIRYARQAGRPPTFRFTGSRLGSDGVKTKATASCLALFL